jgi:hypothetical protein
MMNIIHRNEVKYDNTCLVVLPFQFHLVYVWQLQCINNLTHNPLVTGCCLLITVKYPFYLLFIVFLLCCSSTVSSDCLFCIAPFGILLRLFVLVVLFRSLSTEIVLKSVITHSSIYILMVLCHQYTIGLIHWHFHKKLKNL